MRDKTLSDFGFKFQAKLISCIMTDASFVSQIYDLVKIEYFDSESVKFLIDRSLEYFKKNKKPPTLDVLKVFIDRVDDELLKQEIINTLKEAVKSATATDLDFIKETTIDFCKNQELKGAILESVQLLKNSDYDAIKTLIDNALKVGMNSDIGLDYFDDVDLRYQEDSRHPLSTGWPVIDEITNGGIAPGELAVAIAPSGAGKCVGPNTEIEIEYEEIGINLKNITGSDITVWLSPWDEFEIDGKILLTHDIINIFSLVNEIKNIKNQ